MTKEDALQNDDSDNTEKKTRRDFLATGIAGIAGSTLLAEQVAKGKTIAGGNPSEILKPGLLQAEAPKQGNPGGGRRL